MKEDEGEDELVHELVSNAIESLMDEMEADRNDCDTSRAQSNISVG